MHTFSIIADQMQLDIWLPIASLAPAQNGLGLILCMAFAIAVCYCLLTID